MPDETAPAASLAGRDRPHALNGAPAEDAHAKPDTSSRARALILRARPGLNPGALQRLLCPHAPTARADWGWPLRTSAASSASGSPGADAPGWHAYVRGAAALADPLCAAFVSRSGLSALARPRAGVRALRLPTVRASLGRRATRVALFVLPASEEGGKPQALVAVGYASGAVAFFDAKTAAFRAITRPAEAGVRSLRFQSSLHWGVSAHDPNPEGGGLLAVTGGGLLCLLPSSQIVAVLRAGRTAEPDASGWTLWQPPTRGPVTDAAPLAAAPTHICDVDRRDSRAPLRLVAAGGSPALVCYDCSRDPAFSARASLKKAASGLYSFAQGFFSSDPPVETVETAGDAPRVLGTATPGVAWADHWDESGGSLLPDVARVRDSAKRLVSVGLAAPGRVLRYSYDGAGAAKMADAVAAGGGADAGSPQRDASSSVDSLGSPTLAGRTADPRSSAGRVAERVVAGPVGSGLAAAADNLGRVFVTDARDMATIRFFKGYRDAQVGWLSSSSTSSSSESPLLAILAPRTNLLELHTPMPGPRVSAFRVQPGSRLLQTPVFDVFLVTPSGGLFQLCGAGTPRSAVDAAARRGPASPRKGATAAPDPPDDETVTAFLEAARSQNAPRATDVLDSLAREPSKVAHVMARLLAPGAREGVPAGMHVRLSDHAAGLAAADGAKDLEMRYAAHMQLAEAYGVLAVSGIGGGRAGTERPLADDSLAAGITSAAGFDPESKPLVPPAVEEFITSHALAPAERGGAPRLRPRVGLSPSALDGVAQAYFGRLLSGGRADGAHCLQTLRRLGLTAGEQADLFGRFFLAAPVGSLLATPADAGASRLRAALAGLRPAGDEALLDQVDSAGNAAPALLLARLALADCERAAGEMEGNPPGEAVDGEAARGRWMGAQARVEECILLRELVAGTSVADDVGMSVKPVHCGGGRGYAERRAAALLVGKGEYAAAAGVLAGLRDARLDAASMARVTAAALAAARARAARLLKGPRGDSVPTGVREWVLDAPAEEIGEMGGDTGDDAMHLIGVRTVMLAAHAHAPDASVDGVRCLQLAEAMTAAVAADAAADAAAER